jgi:hypothetical protein
MVLALVGCGGIHETRPVLVGPAVGREPVIGQPSVIPEGPRRGDAPDGIVRGFLAAAAGFAGDHEVARSFLASGRRDTWRPQAAVTIYPRTSSLSIATERLDGRRVPLSLRTAGARSTTASPTAPSPQASAVTPGTAGGQSAGTTPVTTATTATRGSFRLDADPLQTSRVAQVRVRTPVLATVNSRGSYTAAPAGKRIEVWFTLEREGSEWRIKNLLDGILLSENLFTPAFRSLPVYFPDRTGSYLVPDLRWFPSTATITTSLVEAVLAGPSRWLSPAVTNGAPRGTRLAIPVAPQNGVATVDLSLEARRAGPNQRRQLLQQLEATLGQLRLTVKLTVKQSAFNPSQVQVPGMTNPGQAVAPEPLRLRPEVMSSHPVFLDDRAQIQRLEPTGVVPVASVEALRSRRSRAIAVALDGSAYAALWAPAGSAGNSQVRYRAVQGPEVGRTRLLVEGRDLTPPSFDPEGWVWTAPAANPGWVLAARPGNRPVRVTAPRLRGHRVISLRLSWDGARAVAVIRDGGRIRLVAMAVGRSPDHTPLRLSKPFDLLGDLVSARDAVWADSRTVVVLGRRRQGMEQPLRVEVGGQCDPVGEVAGARTVAARIDPDSGQARIYVGTASGVLKEQQDSGWVQVARGRRPVYPG